MEIVDVVLHAPSRWVLFVAVLCVWVYVLSGIGSTAAQTADQPAKTPPAPQAADQPAAIQIESSNPFSGDPDAIQTGRALYFKCARNATAKKADGKSPRWGGYAKDLRKFWQGYSKFVLIVIQGVKGKQMPPWGDVLSGNEISHIGAYLETLAMEGANWK